MLTIKQILDDKEAVIRGLEKKHFAHAAEAVEKVLEINNRRKAAQTELDALLAQVNALSKSIGGLMKEGKKEEAEAAKQSRELKEKKQMLLGLIAEKENEELKSKSADELKAMLESLN